MFRRERRIVQITGAADDVMDYLRKRWVALDVKPVTVQTTAATKAWKYERANGHYHYTELIYWHESETG